MAEEEAVLMANEAFYRAFAEGDNEGMDEIWARDAQVACIHPGWNPLEGREAVLDSWAAIFRSPNAPHVRCRNARAYLYGDAAYVICYEELAEGYLVATNTFVREDGRWRMVNHQAGPAASPPEPEPEGPSFFH